MNKLLEEVMAMMVENRPPSEVLPKMRAAMHEAQRRAIQCMTRETLALTLFGSLVALLWHSGMAWWVGMPAYLATAFFVRELVASVRMYWLAGQVLRNLPQE